MRELQVWVDGASQKLLALGAKSTAKAYLDRIGRKTKDGEVRYVRLLTGDHITHQLHEHLLNVIALPTASVGWNRSEKYGQMTISEHAVLLAIPTSHPTQFRGLKLEGPEHASLFSDVFWEALGVGITLRNSRSLELLCEDCGSGRPERDRLEEALTEIERGQETPTLGSA